MTPEDGQKRVEYYQQAASWSEDRNASLQASRKIAWIIAMVAAIIAILEALALYALTPLKTVVPYTLLVDKQTGYVQALDPIKHVSVATDSALTQSFLVQYVIAREEFDIAAVKNDFKHVILWSSGEARSNYANTMQSSNPESPLNFLPRSSVVNVRIRSVSPLDKNSAMVRFETTRTDKGSAPAAQENWIAIVKYQYSNAPMNIEDRFINPLGFQVISYHKNAETAPSPYLNPTPLNPVQQDFEQNQIPVGGSR